MRRGGITLFILCAVLLCAVRALGVQRFPPPQFETDYTVPEHYDPPARAGVWNLVDTAVLVVCLSLASWFMLKLRSRRAMIGLMVFSVLYFGFFRRGCVCPIGAIGNVTISVFDATYALPWVVVAFFLLPLVFALFFGRGFCAGVCPFGALQDLVLLEPVKIAPWVESGLRMAAWTYLALAVLFAATGAGLLICRYDPFISFFRLGANSTLWILGIGMILTSVFIGRPYCRFLCPYGLLLRQCGRVSKYRVTVTPDECIHCRLCEDACPFGAIEHPTAPWPENDLPRDRRRLVMLILLLPALIAGGGWLGRKAVPLLADQHPTVEMARGIHVDENSLSEQQKELMVSVERVKAQFAFWGMLVGGFLALIAGGKLIEHSIRKYRMDYEADRSGCFGCGRCFTYCPKHHEKKGKIAIPQDERVGL